ncbi:MAG: glycosyltransferase involved in cell wall biosynthesis [Methylophilaceae bacterium]|jgi:glycosyltransferase involved in cell wall biosynthesis
MDISVVIPVYQCEESLAQLHKRLTISLKSLVSDYEIIFIDDRSLGNTWELIQSISKKDNFVRGLRLSRNFGQHVAITAGLEESLGEWVVVMDCDLQDKPEEIVKLYKASQRGFDIVFAQRVDRKDSYLKKITSRLFYKSLSYLTGTKLDPLVANFGIYNRKVINAILSMKETHKYFPLMVRWVGFSSISIPVEHMQREVSKTSYTFKSLLTLSVGIILSFSNKPLRLIIKLGFTISLLSAIYALIIIINVLLNGTILPGWSSIMVSIWFNSGMLMSIVGIVGLYVGKSFDEAKYRPVYIVEDRI